MPLFDRTRRANYPDRLGRRYVLYGSGTQLFRTDGVSILSRSGRSRPLPRRQLRTLPLVYTKMFANLIQYLSCWYKRSEFGIRAAIFFSAAALAGSFGGLLAAGIAQMKGVGGKPGWAWILYVTISILKILSVYTDNP